MSQVKTVKSHIVDQLQGATDGTPADLHKGGASPTGRPHPPPEEDLGGGDICSPEPSADDGSM